jgi:hypothetical protein
MWKQIEADGCVWQVRSIASPGAGTGQDQEMLEFATDEGNRPPRRLLVERGALGSMTEAELRAAYLKARPIGGDHYGRPGKQMPDAAAREQG